MAEVFTMIGDMIRELDKMTEIEVEEMRQEWLEAMKERCTTDKEYDEIERFINALCVVTLERRKEQVA